MELLLDVHLYKKIMQLFGVAETVSDLSFALFQGDRSRASDESKLNIGF